MNLNLLQLRYFQMVARLEHITKAAEALAIAQPSLSKTISQLEEALGVPLFDRVGRQIRLNRFGKAFLSHVERVFDEDLAIHAGTQFLPGLLSAFREHYPHIHFRVSQHAAQSALEKLERGEVRLCITCLPLSRPDIDSLPLLTEDILLAVPFDHPLAPRASFSLEEIVDEPFVTLTPGYHLREITQALWEHHGLNPQIAFEVNNPGTIPALIKARLGIGFVPALTWHDVLTSLVLLPVEGATLQRTLAIAWHRGSYLSQAERLFRDFVVDYCVHSDILRAKSIF